MTRWAGECDVDNACEHAYSNDYSCFCDVCDATSDDELDHGGYD